MDDLISRREAIDAIVNKVSGIGLHDNSEVARYGATFRQHEIIDIIESLPSVQSETNCSEIPNNSDLISRTQAIEAVSRGCQEFRGIFAECEKNLNELPPAQPQYTELTPEEAASEISSGSIMSASYWLDVMMRLKQMGYVICRKKG